MPRALMPATFRAPLSGDVTQAINPWKWVFDWAGSNFSLINVNLGRSSDPDLEQEILEEVGSYGRQLGRIGETVAVLVDQLDLDKLTPEQKKTIKAFEAQMTEIQAIKERRRTR